MEKILVKNIVGVGYVALRYDERAEGSYRSIPS
jgi:hypothetical protein